MLGSDDGSAKRSVGKGVWGSAVKLPQWGSGAEPQQNWLGGLGERYELPQWGPGRSPGRQRIWSDLEG